MIAARERCNSLLVNIVLLSWKMIALAVCKSELIM